MTPLRIQRRRTRGWKMPPNTLSVTRPGKWGNPFTIKSVTEKYILAAIKYHFDRYISRRRAQGVAVARYELWLDKIIHWPYLYDAPPAAKDIATLRGKNLACFCKLCARHQDGKPFDEVCNDCDPCHADPLGIRANKPLEAT